jgi:hypothetical protein
VIFKERPQLHRRVHAWRFLDRRVVARIQAADQGCGDKPLAISA